MEHVITILMQDQYFKPAVVLLLLFNFWRSSAIEKKVSNGYFLRKDEAEPIKAQLDRVEERVGLLEQRCMNMKEGSKDEQVL